ncbi:chord-domain-containing protein [Sparassis crispa]|uniref:Chord-domain-containing protein n=1 Tax=Sparassis crispa TaxID=139825 RepID=A0A401GIP8_9APHY|nr:chord-domain-containing protein [Sparassis crispa]GBE82049.1 chord-domain-containing protein [Sparassis crispa]
MPRCTHKGCGQEYDAANNTTESCTYHSGGPVFHEGLKSWSCCSDSNKPVLDFDEFMNIPGCTTGFHTDEAVKTEAPKPSANVNLKMADSQAGKEIYTSKPSGSEAFTATVASPSAVKPAPTEEEEEDLAATVPSGTKCRHNGCQAIFESDEVNRIGNGPGTVCAYHPMPPIFREGSKGYLCCKRRVLEFDEFLKIQGCKTGRHVFVPKSSVKDTTEQFTDCRIDHYQTPTEVHVSVFAKQVDKDRSSVRIEQSRIQLDLYLPASKRFRKSIELFGPVDPEASSYKYYGTKVELILKKQDTRSWTLLEKTDRNLGGISLTFGVSGRTGTIGGKDLILDESNKSRAS